MGSSNSKVSVLSTNHVVVNVVVVVCDDGKIFLNEFGIENLFSDFVKVAIFMRM